MCKEKDRNSKRERGIEKKLLISILGQRVKLTFLPLNKTESSVWTRYECLNEQVKNSATVLYILILLHINSNVHAALSGCAAPNPLQIAQR